MPAEPWHVEYRRLFRKAYPDIALDNISFVEVANALAHFEELAFATRDTPWDRFLQGNRAAINEEAKRGAFLFFGKARCVVCHSGPLFSDFEFHSIGVKTFGPGYDGKGSDSGRYRITKRNEDRYKFRTAPLRNVTLTAPYFHDGSVTTLEGAIRQHMFPLYYADKYDKSGGFVMTIDEIDAISPVLTIRTSFNEQDITDLIAFLRTLDDPAKRYIDRIIPGSVPSGLPIASPPNDSSFLLR